MKFPDGEIKRFLCFLGTVVVHRSQQRGRQAGRLKVLYISILRWRSTQSVSSAKWCKILLPQFVLRYTHETVVGRRDTNNKRVIGTPSIPVSSRMSPFDVSTHSRLNRPSLPLLLHICWQDDYLWNIRPSPDDSYVQQNAKLLNQAHLLWQADNRNSDRILCSIVSHCYVCFQRASMRNFPQIGTLLTVIKGVCISQNWTGCK